MKIRDIAIVLFSVGFGITCLCFGVLWMMIAKDLGEKVDILEQEIIELKQEAIQLRWESEQTTMYCMEDELVQNEE